MGLIFCNSFRMLNCGYVSFLLEKAISLLLELFLNYSANRDAAYIKRRQRKFLYCAAFDIRRAVENSLPSNTKCSYCRRTLSCRQNSGRFWRHRRNSSSRVDWCIRNTNNGNHRSSCRVCECLSHFDDLAVAEAFELSQDYCNLRRQRKLCFRQLPDFALPSTLAFQ